MAIKKSGHKQKHTSKSNITVKYFKENSVVVTTRARQLSYKKTWQNGYRRDLKATQGPRTIAQGRSTVTKGKRDAFEEFCGCNHKGAATQLQEDMAERVQKGLQGNSKTTGHDTGKI